LLSIQVPGTRHPGELEPKKNALTGQYLLVDVRAQLPHIEARIEIVGFKPIARVLQAPLGKTPDHLAECITGGRKTILGVGAPHHWEIAMKKPSWLLAEAFAAHLKTAPANWSAIAREQHIDPATSPYSRHLVREGGKIALRLKEEPMAAADKVFAGSIPEIYDRYLVPLIFDAYALDLAERVAESGPQDVLEIAAGTGALTRTMASRLPACVHIVATDLNRPMLNHAKARQSHADRIDWKQADALALPFEDERFDVVACQFGVMFFPDKIQGYKEARRILKPGGRFLFNVWDRISENEFANVVNEALTVFFPRDPPCFMARTPHGYHDAERIRVELNAAGFSKISVEAVDGSETSSILRLPSARGPH
jgi:ubiquinone/menaquinone biosynthesis C-methylase UbiE